VPAPAERSPCGTIGGPTPVTDAGRSFPVPSYLPPPARTLLPWTRRYVAGIAARAQVDPGDVWDEALAALLRASVFFKAGAGTFTRYAKCAVGRGTARYVQRPARRRHRHGPTVPLDDPAAVPLLTVASAEAEAVGREQARQRARVLRQHEQLAIARADHNTARRLRAAADTAERFARRT
jgi:hypothetical protein